MKILVDADACPNAIKDIIFRAAKRLRLQVILFANHVINIPKSPYIRFVQVEKGFDVADSEIVKRVLKGDLVITADIPLASQVIEQEAIAINVRGTVYTEENIKEKLAMRNLMDEIRSQGQLVGGPKTLGQTDLQAFANALDRMLTKYRKQ